LQVSARNDQKAAPDAEKAGQRTDECAEHDESRKILPIKVHRRVPAAGTPCEHGYAHNHHKNVKQKQQLLAVDHFAKI
jgi:hypothetical protein